MRVILTALLLGACWLLVSDSCCGWPSELVAVKGGCIMRVLLRFKWISTRFDARQTLVGDACRHVAVMAGWLLDCSR